MCVKVDLIFLFWSRPLGVFTFSCYRTVDLFIPGRDWFNIPWAGSQVESQSWTRLLFYYCSFWCVFRILISNPSLFPIILRNELFIQYKTDRSLSYAGECTAEYDISCLSAYLNLQVWTRLYFGLFCSLILILILIPCITSFLLFVSLARFIFCY